jgi:hypothetical protein
MVLSVVLIDIGLVAGRVLTFTPISAMPGAVLAVGWLALSLVAAATFVIWGTRSKSLWDDLRLPTAAGLAGGVMMIGHMTLENFGSRVGEDWRLTIAVMFATFALWFSSGWWTARKYDTILAGTVAGCWAAIVSVMLAVTFGFVGMYFDVPSAEYVATWPEFIQSGWSDPHAFAIANTLDAATSHIVTALLLGTLLGGAGGLIRRRVPSYS